jgi:hypothetical protein
MKATIFIHSSIQHQRVCFGGDTSISLQSDIGKHSISNLLFGIIDYRVYRIKLVARSGWEDYRRIGRQSLAIS